MVAIIGGFLLTRYMTVEGEIRGADRALHQTQARLAAAEDRVEAARCELAAYDLDDLFEAPHFVDHLIVAARNHTVVSMDEARQMLPLELFRDSDVEPRLRMWNEEARRAQFSELWLNFPQRLTYPRLREFAETRQVNVGIDSIWLRLYEVAKEAKRLKDTSQFPGLSIDDFEIADNDAPRRPQFEERLHVAATTRDALQAEVGLARINRTSIAEPNGLRWEVVVLVIVALLTIVPSLLLLAPQPANLSRAQSALVVALFLLGFGMLIAYLVTHANRVRSAWALVGETSDSSVDGLPAERAGTADQ